MLDVVIIVAYFVTILVIGILSRSKGEATASEYFMSSRSLTWPAIAMSTIATNISASHFLGMAGSTYKFGLAQGNFELNAIFGIVVSAFIFVPLFVTARVTTVTEYFEMKFGTKVAFSYSALMLVLYGFLYLGGALFWAAYAINSLFPKLTMLIHPDESIRLIVLIVSLGLFSAFYTYLGGLTAVVRTDKVQFVLLLVGGFATLYYSIDYIGGLDKLWQLESVRYPGESPMHLHLPSTDDKLPWFALVGMNLLNLQYWGANQVILQRALAAKDLRNAQLGLLVGGVLKYFMVMIIIVPALSLLHDSHPALADPDQAYGTLINAVVPNGIRGFILCGLFASMMSTVDSIFNSLSTLFSIDIFKRHLRPGASEQTVVKVGKIAIIGALVTGLSFAFVVVYLKTGAAKQDALTHFFKEVGYYIKNGFVVLIVAAAFMSRPNKLAVLGGLFISIPLYMLFKYALAPAPYFPGVSYLERAGWVIMISVAVVVVASRLWPGEAARESPGSLFVPWRQLIQVSGRRVGAIGIALVLSLVLTHVVFH